MTSPHCAAAIFSFCGTTRQTTQVLPTQRPSETATRAPCQAAQRAVATLGVKAGHGRQILDGQHPGGAMAPRAAGSLSAPRSD